MFVPQRSPLLLLCVMSCRLGKPNGLTDVGKLSEQQTRRTAPRTRPRPATRPGDTRPRRNRETGPGRTGSWRTHQHFDAGDTNRYGTFPQLNLLMDAPRIVEVIRAGPRKSPAAQGLVGRHNPTTGHDDPTGSDQLSPGFTHPSPRTDINDRPKFPRSMTCAVTHSAILGRSGWWPRNDDDPKRMPHRLSGSVTRRPLPSTTSSTAAPPLGR